MCSSWDMIWSLLPGYRKERMIGLLCLQMEDSPFNMMPLGNRAFPCKKKKKMWGEGANQQRHLFRWKPSVGRVKESQDCLCFRHFLLDPKRGGEHGGGVGAAEGWRGFLFPCSILSYTLPTHTLMCALTLRKQSASFSQNSALSLYIWGGKVFLDAVGFAASAGKY